MTEGFSGADLTELCQRACKAAIRDSIGAEEERRKIVEAQGGDVEMQEENAVDAVPYITRKHFEEAFFAARKSVSQTDLGRFEEFRRKMDPAYAKKVGGTSTVPKITWPEDTTAQFNAGNDDDLYS